MASGWHKDHYRHYLAAKGVSTAKYYKAKQPGDDVLDKILKGAKGASVPLGDQPTTPSVSPGRRLKALEAEAALERKSEELQKAKRPVEQALKMLDAGNYSMAQKILQNPKKFNLDKHPEDVAALKSALNARAMILAQSQQPIPDFIKKNIDPSLLKRVEMIESANETRLKRELESPLKKELREEIIPELAGAAIGKPIELAGEGAAVSEAGIASGLQALKSARGLGEEGGVKGLEGQENMLAQTPFVTDNSFVDVLKGKNLGRLNSGYDAIGGGPTINPLLAPTTKERKATEIVQEQVDSLYGDKEKLAEVDLSAFEKGNQAFKEGRREGVIAAMMDLQAKQDTLKDRWNLTNMTWRNVNSPENHRSAFQKGDSNPLLDGSVGGSRIAEQTEKINKVRQSIVEANQKVQARKRQLQFRLQRLDATVPPETDTPDKAVVRFEKPKQSFFDSIQNPTVDALKKTERQL